MRIKKEFEEFCEKNPKSLVEVNEVKILKCSEFENFVVKLIKKLNACGYFNKFKRLENDLIKAKGLFPIKLPKSFQKSTLYLDFLFKNQRGVHSDDLELIFRYLEVESYQHAALVRGFTQLFDENQRKLFVTQVYQSNQQKIVAFLTKHKEKVVQVFGEYKNNQNKVNLNDYLLIMRKICEIDPHFQLFENKADVEPFLNKVNSLKTVLASAKRYFFDYLGLSQKIYPSVGSIDIGYEVYWEFFDYLIKMIPSFYIEYGLGGEADNLFKLRSELEETRDKYQQKLSSCKSELEEEIMKSTQFLLRHSEEFRTADQRS